MYKTILSIILVCFLACLPVYSEDLPGEECTDICDEFCDSYDPDSQLCIPINQNSYLLSLAGILILVVSYKKISKRLK